MTKSILILLVTAVSFFSSPLFAVSEDNYPLVYKILKEKQNFKSIGFFGVNDHFIDVLKYGESIGERGSVVISVGSNQASLSYIETAYDLYQMGFSPIYVTSHRGQGFSDRALDDVYKRYVEDFSFYANDLEKLVSIVKSEVGETDLYLIAHSMGGAIGLDYLQRGLTAFKKVAFVAPMFKINLPSSEEQTIKEAYAACVLNMGGLKCTDYIPGGGKPVSKGFDESAFTTSKVRYDFLKALIADNPLAVLGSPTIQWVREAVKANIKARSPELIKQIKTPFLLLQAEKDYVVSNDGQDLICNQTELCSKKVINGALHGLLTESDVYRDLVMLSLDNYLN